MLSVAEFAPDQTSLESGVTGYVNNVVPVTALSYGPLPSLVSTGDALTLRCQGAGSFRGKIGTIKNFAGDANDLYEWDGVSAWGNVTRASGGAYSVQTDDMWDMTQYGNYVIATNGTDAAQYYLIDTSTKFAALAGSPPVARFCWTALEQVVLGRLANKLNTIQWSAIGDPTGWTIGVNLCDEQEFPEAGRVMGGTGIGTSMTVLCESQIHIGTFVGTGDVWRFRPISIDRGCSAEGSIASWQGVTFFLAYDGFYMLAGESLLPIGTQKVDNYFWTNVNDNYLYRIVAAVDPVKKLYIVAFPSTSSADGTPDTLLIYNFDIKRWSRADVSLDFLYRARTNVGYTLDNLPYSNLDTMPISLDSNLLSGSPKDTLAAFYTDKKLAFFNGANLEATIDTIEGQITPGARTKVRAVRPHVDGGSPTVSLGIRNKIEDAVSWSAASTIRTSGRCPTPSNSLARFHRARLTVPAGSTWTYARGVDLETSGGGKL